MTTTMNAIHTRTNILTAISAATLTVLCLANHVTAFQPASLNTCNIPHARSSFSSSLAMAPRFDKDTARWIPSSDDEQASAGYGPIGSLLRQGPAPFLQRLFNADDYDQAVLKFMAGEQPPCSRDEAQASMDAYLQNPNDWAFNRMEEQKTGRKRDYLTLKTDQIVLTLAWAAIVVAGAGRVAYCLVNHELFWDFVK